MVVPPLLLLVEFILIRLTSSREVLLGCRSRLGGAFSPEQGNGPYTYVPLTPMASTPKYGFVPVDDNLMQRPKPG